MATKAPKSIPKKMPAKPVRPNSMLVTPPKMPATTPMGKPKFSPQPDWTMGIKLRTKIENMPKRARTFSTESPRDTPAAGAAAKRANRNRPMISRGSPIR